MPNIPPSPSSVYADYTKCRYELLGRRDDLERFSRTRVFNSEDVGDCLKSCRVDSELTEARDGRVAGMLCYRPEGLTNYDTACEQQR